MKIVLKMLAVAFICLSTQSFAQTLKFGHINMTEVIALMPERDSAVVQLEKYGKSLEETLQGMDAEFRTKLNEYQQKQKDWLPAVLEAKEKELQEIQTRLQQFNANAQQEFQQLEQQLFAPILQKAKEGVTKVAKANGFIYVFDISAGSLAYFDEAKSENILPLVKQELGIPADKTVPMGSQQAQR